MYMIIRARTVYSCICSIYRILQNSIPRLRLLCSVPRYSTILSRELNFHPLRSRCQRSGRISRAQPFALARQPIADYYLVVDRSRTLSLSPPSLPSLSPSLPSLSPSLAPRAQYWDVTKSPLSSRRAFHLPVCQCEKYVILHELKGCVISFLIISRCTKIFYVYLTLLLTDNILLCAIWSLLTFNVKKSSVAYSCLNQLVLTK